MLRAERSNCHYRGSRADQANLKKLLREIAETRVRYGYRRIHVLLRRECRDVKGNRSSTVRLDVMQSLPTRAVQARRPNQTRPGFNARWTESGGQVNGHRRSPWRLLGRKRPSAISDNCSSIKMPETKKAAPIAQGGPFHSAAAMRYATVFSGRGRRFSTMRADLPERPRR